MPDFEDERSDPPNVVRLETSEQPSGADPTAGLRDALSALESKIQSADGIVGLIDWLHEVESAVSSIPQHQVSHTCDEIKELIHSLLSINAEIQNLVRLKQLLG